MIDTPIHDDLQDILGIDPRSEDRAAEPLAVRATARDDGLSPARHRQV